MMWKIYAAVRKQDSRNASYNFQSSIRQYSCNDRAQEENTIGARRRTNLIKSRKARQRILQYFVGYFITYCFPIIDTMFRDIESIDNLLEILTTIFYPLGGFFNLIVFVLPAVHKVQERNVELCICRTLVLAIVSYAGPSNGEAQALRHERRASIAERTPPVTIDSPIDRNESDQSSNEQ